MTTITYACNHHPYVANPPGQHAHAIDRPWVEVTATFNGLSHRIWCLVDTGADYTMLDLGTAAAFGVNHLALPPISITLGDGTTSAAHFGELTNVTLQFAGTQVPTAGALAGVSVLLGPVAVPLLGRSTLLQQSGSLVGAGFDIGQWLHT